MELLVQRLQRIADTVNRRADVLLSFAVMAVVFMLVLPLPTPIIDALVAVNISVSALLLMVAMSLPTPAAFTSFPSVLLITTLFRLALSISTTRLILLQADAGHIVQTFGEFVAGGNLVVGLIVFLILTIVQFIVVSKGAERVAEVAARFTLDAMPGKQMAIDNDLRSGDIDSREATRRRSNLEKESQLYGAMDGAMKFVKGDAIASIIMLVVNLIGGLLIGTMQKKMAVGDAAHLYSVLTIGEGLVAQIPALLISIAAGLIVTRVSATSLGITNIGRDIVDQVLAQPRALLICAAILLLFAAIPGMPTSIFLLLATAVGALGARMMWPSVQRKSNGTSSVLDRTQTPFVAARSDEAQNSVPNFVLTAPLILEISSDLSSAFPEGQLITRLEALRGALFSEMGVAFPPLQVHLSNAMPPGHYALRINEVPVAQTPIWPHSVFVRESIDTLGALQIPFETGPALSPILPATWVPEREIPRLKDLGIGFMSPLELALYHIAMLLRRHAPEFVGVQETRFLISKLEEGYPDLVKELQRVLPPQKISEVLQRLVSEGISIRNLRGITEALIEWSQKEKDAVLLTEHIRAVLKRQISFKYSSSAKALPAYLLGDKVEDAIRNAVRQTSVGSYLALDPTVAREIVDAVKSAVGNLSMVSHLPVLLTSMDVRRYVRKLIEQDFFDLAVLSYQELSTDINVQPLARIELDLS